MYVIQITVSFVLLFLLSAVCEFAAVVSADVAARISK